MENRKSNYDFLRESYNGRKALTEFDELCDWYFSSRERTVQICAHRAYRDFCRRLTGIKNEPKKDDWREREEQLISNEILNIISAPPSDEKLFDNLHKKLCQSVMEEAKTISLKNGFSYGLAQKWVNMTFKYMLIMEKWDDTLSQLTPFLHVPVDSYIMEAASNESVPILKKTGTYVVYKENVSKPWSNWNYEEYIKFQNDLRKLRPQYPCPIDWEGPAWIKIAQLRKEKKNKSKNKQK